MEVHSYSPITMEGCFDRRRVKIFPWCEECTVSGHGTYILSAFGSTNEETEVKNEREGSRELVTYMQQSTGKHRPYHEQLCRYNQRPAKQARHHCKRRASGRENHHKWWPKEDPKARRSKRIIAQ